MEMVDEMPSISVNLSALSDEPAPIVYHRNAIDVVLIELLTTAHLIVDSPEIARLEALIEAEL